MKSLTSIGAFLAALTVVAAPIAAQQPREEFVVIKAATVITGSGEEIDQGEIVIVDGLIRLVGRNLEYPASAEVIDARDRVVMPGMIHPRARLDLPRYSRSGIHADLDVRSEVYLEQLDFEELLQAGFTAVCLIPEGSGVPGVSAIYRTGGPEESQALKHVPYLRVTMGDPGRDKQAMRNAFRKAREEIAKLEKAKSDWEAKQKEAAEAQKKAEEQQPEAPKDQPPPPPQEAKEPAKPEEYKPPAIDAAHERLVKILQDELKLPLFIEVASAADVLHVLDVFEAEPKFELIFYLDRGAASDYNYVIDELVKAKRPILTVPTTGTLPQTSNRYNLAGDLELSGAAVTLAPTSDSGGALESFRRQVAELVRWGLPREKAIAAITIGQANLVGLGERMGSIEKGKEANLIFLDDDPLSPFSEVKRVMILGKTAWEAEE